MAGTQQELLKHAWLEGRTGYLSAWSEAKLWAVREIWRADKKSGHGLQTFAASLVTKVGTNEKPTQRAVGLFYEKIDADPEWFPGKTRRTKFGPDRALTGQQVSAIARSAQAMKARGVEPTYGMIVASCPKAVLNPETNQAVGKKRVYDVFRENCADEGAEENWEHKPRYSKQALTAQMVAKRLAFGVHVQSWGRTPTWFYNHVVWVDICNSILPRSERKASEQALARKGNKGWGSPGCEMHSSNLRGAKESLKQQSWDTIKIWWAPILTRGKLHIEAFDADFPGENEGGAAALVSKARAAVNLRFQGGATQPDTIWTDRGKGFYFTGNGGITGAYQQALRDHRFKGAWGDDASVQPGTLQELMLHETAVSWIRLRLGRTVPAKPWEETRAEYTARLKMICEDINTNLEVENLCRGFHKRIQKLVDREGGRLKE